MNSRWVRRDQSSVRRWVVVEGHCGCPVSIGYLWQWASCLVGLSALVLLRCMVQIYLVEDPAVEAEGHSCRTAVVAVPMRVRVSIHLFDCATARLRARDVKHVPGCTRTVVAVG